MAAASSTSPRRAAPSWRPSVEPTKRWPKSTGPKASAGAILAGGRSSASSVEDHQSSRIRAEERRNSPSLAGGDVQRAGVTMDDDLFPGFESHWVDTEVGRVFARSKGDGPPLVLLHGFPQTHVMWHRLAPTLAETYRVVCMDLRGYGWSTAPKGDAAHETYSKRAMGRDVITVMEALGAVRFALVGHDRGARVGYRLALDHPGRVERLSLLDVLPTAYVWGQMKAGKVPPAHWAFLSQPSPRPEDEIGADPVSYFEGLMKKWSASGDLSAFDHRALAAYRSGFNEPSRIHAFCEDY